MGCTQSVGQKPSKINKPIVLFILGGPGSGKGTLCDQLVAKLHLNHYSTGDLLRKEQEENPESELSKTIKACMVEGKLVSSEVLLEIIKKNILELKAKSDPTKPPPIILLDGFPRSQENIDAWEKFKMGEVVEARFCLYLECGFETMEKRIMGRAQTSGRADDKPETIKKRFETFENQTKPILDYFIKIKKLVKVNAETDPDTVYKATLEKFKEYKINTDPNQKQTVDLKHAVDEKIKETNHEVRKEAEKVEEKVEEKVAEVQKEAEK